MGSSETKDTDVDGLSLGDQSLHQVTIPKQWSASSLPEAAQKHLVSSHVISNLKSYRRDFHEYHDTKKRVDSQSKPAAQLSFVFDSDEDAVAPLAKVSTISAIWGTDGYRDSHGKALKSTDAITVDLLGLIKPRVEKSAVEQKRRVKEKAEVFTPLWVVNVMNNLIDDERLYGGAFNTHPLKNSVPEDGDLKGNSLKGSGEAPGAVDQKLWEASESPVDFSEGRVKTPGMTWERYVRSLVLEMTAGEGPYLFSRYDPTTGSFVPVRDARGRFQRVGLLDRKLRVVSENAGSLDEWLKWAFVAVDSTYGYEWQGDNLILARVNLINTVFDYLTDFVNFKKISEASESGTSESGELSKVLLEELAVILAELASWQIVQMDGLTMTIPESCRKSCRSCEKSLRYGHEGKVPVVQWGGAAKPFEDFLK